MPGSICTVADVRRVVVTTLGDADMQALIDDEDAQMQARLGVHADGIVSVTETVTAGGSGSVAVGRPIASVTSISERPRGGIAGVVAPTLYGIDDAAGGLIERLYGRWDRRVTVTYSPADDTAARRRVLIELVRGRIERTAMASESVAGEYSYAAPDWEAERQRLYATLILPGV